MALRAGRRFRLHRLGWCIGLALGLATPTGPFSDAQPRPGNGDIAPSEFGCCISESTPRRIAKADCDGLFFADAPFRQARLVDPASPDQLLARIDYGAPFLCSRDMRGYLSRAWESEKKEKSHRAQEWRLGAGYKNSARAYISQTLLLTWKPLVLMGYCKTKDAGCEPDRMKPDLVLPPSTSSAPGPYVLRLLLAPDKQGKDEWRLVIQSLDKVPKKGAGNDGPYTVKELLRYEIPMEYSCTNSKCTPDPPELLDPSMDEAALAKRRSKMLAAQELHIDFGKAADGGSPCNLRVQWGVEALCSWFKLQ